MIITVEEIVLPKHCQLFTIDYPTTVTAVLLILDKNSMQVVFIKCCSSSLPLVTPPQPAAD